jgi:hypothetical protein
MSEKTFEELLFEEEMKLKIETENKNKLIKEEKKENLKEQYKEIMIKDIIYNILDKININKKEEIKKINNINLEGKTYIERKILLLNQNNNEWGSLGDLKKSYCRLEREQMKLREEKENNTLINNKNLKNEIKEDFNTLLNKKRINNNNPIHSGYTPIKKNKIYYNEKYEDFDTFMSKVIKSKPKIQIQKEKFLNSQNK